MKFADYCQQIPEFPNRFHFSIPHQYVYVMESSRNSKLWQMNRTAQAKTCAQLRSWHLKITERKWAQTLALVCTRLRNWAQILTRNHHGVAKSSPNLLVVRPGWLKWAQMSANELKVKNLRSVALVCAQICLALFCTFAQIVRFLRNNRGIFHASNRFARRSLAYHHAKWEVGQTHIANSCHTIRVAAGSLITR